MLASANRRGGDAHKASVAQFSLGVTNDNASRYSTAVEVIESLQPTELLSCRCSAIKSSLECAKNSVMRMECALLTIAW